MIKLVCEKLTKNFLIMICYLGFFTVMAQSPSLDDWIERWIQTDWTKIVVGKDGCLWTNKNERLYIFLPHARERQTQLFEGDNVDKKLKSFEKLKTMFFHWHPLTFIDSDTSPLPESEYDSLIEGVTGTKLIHLYSRTDFDASRDMKLHVFYGNEKFRWGLYTFKVDETVSDDSKLIDGLWVCAPSNPALLRQPSANRNWEDEISEKGPQAHGFIASGP